MKIIKLLLALCLVASALLLVSCGEECTHEWNNGYVAKAPNLENEGQRIHTCTLCGEYKTESIPRLTHTEHTYSSKWGGDDTYHWLICDIKDCETATNKTEHTWVDKYGGGYVCQVCRRTSENS